MASNDMPLLDCVYKEIQLYIHKYEKRQGTIILVFPITTMPFTTRCIEMVAAMMDLMSQNINGHVIVGRPEDFVLLFDQPGLNKHPNGNDIVKKPEKMREIFRLPLVPHAKRWRNKIPLIQLIQDILDPPYVDERVNKKEKGERDDKITLDGPIKENRSGSSNDNNSKVSFKEYVTIVGYSKKPVILPKELQSTTDTSNSAKGTSSSTKLKPDTDNSINGKGNTLSKESSLVSYIKTPKSTPPMTSKKSSTKHMEVHKVFSIPVIDDITSDEQRCDVIVGNDESLLTVKLSKKMKTVPHSEAFIVEYSDGMQYLCTKVDQSEFKKAQLETKCGPKVLGGTKNDEKHTRVCTKSTSTDNNDIEIPIIFEKLKYVENVGIMESDRDLNFVQWKNSNGVFNFLTQIIKIFGSHATLLLVPPRFTKIENNPVYKLTHAREIFNVPSNVCVESTYNMRSYMQWCTRSNAVLFTRSENDGKGAVRNAKTFKVRPMETASPMAILTAFATNAALCEDFPKVHPPDV